jgi:hypothetical protein
MNIIDEQLIITSYSSSNVTQRCLKCGKKLTNYIAYIPNFGEACMDCYIQAAKKDEANNRV